MNCLICGGTYIERKIDDKFENYCEKCNLHRSSNIQKQQDTYEAEFWEESDYSEFTGSDFTDKGVQDLVLTFESWYSYFRPFLDKKKNILDIGSGTGVSCILLEKKGYNMTGVDPDPKNAQLINSKLKKGKCINSYFEDLKIENKVDVVWLTHVIEHLEQPDILLEKCKEWIVPDGIVCIAVPDCGNPNMLDHSLNNPYHIYHFTKNSLKQLFKKSGYDVLQCDSLSNLKKTNRRFHKVMRKAGFENLSSKTEPFYPFHKTVDRDGYEIRCVIQPKIKKLD
jgi:2-polyprenyl-3-methyl-5-hydroxy-6-metoxy-1,4-benzoquinol methylase